MPKVEKEVEEEVGKAISQNVADFESLWAVAVKNKRRRGRHNAIYEELESNKKGKWIFQKEERNVITGITNRLRQKYGDNFEYVVTDAKLVGREGLLFMVKIK